MSKKRSTQLKLKRDLLSGHLFVFCNRRRDRLKILVFDQLGLWICAKRLERGCFKWAQTTNTTVTMNQQELALLLGRSTYRKQRTVNGEEARETW